MYEGFTPLGNPVNQKLHAQFQKDLLDRQTQGMEAWKTYDDWYMEMMRSPTTEQVAPQPQGMRGPRLWR